MDLYIPGYVRGCAALCVIVCFTDFFGSVLTGLGLRSTDPNKKYKYYRVAIYCLVLCGKRRPNFSSRIKFLMQFL